MRDGPGVELGVLVTVGFAAGTCVPAVRGRRVLLGGRATDDLVQAAEQVGHRDVSGGDQQRQHQGVLLLEMVVEDDLQRPGSRGGGQRCGGGGDLADQVEDYGVLT